MALVGRSSPSGDDGDNVTSSEGGVRVVDKVVLGLREHLLDRLLPLLATHAHLHSLLHETGAHDDTVQLADNLARCRHGLVRHDG